MDFLCVFLDTNFLQRLVLFKVKIQMKLEENSHHAIVLFFFLLQLFSICNALDNRFEKFQRKKIALLLKQTHYSYCRLNLLQRNSSTTVLLFYRLPDLKSMYTVLLYDLEQLESQDTFFGSMEYGALQALLLLLQMQKQVKNEVFSSSSKYGDYNSPMVASVSSQWQEILLSHFRLDLHPVFLKYFQQGKKS